MLSTLGGQHLGDGGAVNNIYARAGTRWRMVLHHVSHILTGESEAEG